MVMVWKSNLEEIEQEFIEDFGAKAMPGDKPGVPTAKPPAARRPATGAAKQTSAKTKRSAVSPDKSQYGAATDMNYSYPGGV